MNNPKRRETPSGSLPAFVWWATTIAWTMTIYLLSTETFGVSLTAWVLSEVLRIFSIHLSPEAFQTLHFLIRKLAHLSEYGIFALLLYGSLGSGRNFRWVWKRAVFAGVVAAGYSLTDEFHQLFVPGRTGAVQDTFIDTGGALLAIAGLYVYFRFVQMKARKNAASVANPAET